MLKLVLEITADNNEEMLKAIDKVKSNVDMGALSFSTVANDGHNYKGEILEESELSE